MPQLMLPVGEWKSGACEHGYYPKAECDGFFADVARDGTVFNEPPSPRPAPQGRHATSGEEQMIHACDGGELPKSDCDRFYADVQRDQIQFN
ncbi:MAG: hypothetical protein M3Z25_03820 [Actinomycetota bacterium]|nr:hypothetical protein [Actinomycetota bacterium]